MKNEQEIYTGAYLFRITMVMINAEYRESG